MASNLSHRAISVVRSAASLATDPALLIAAVLQHLGLGKESSPVIATA